jgi:hypothetical protein
VAISPYWLRRHVSDSKCEQFNDSNPENQNCQCYRIVLEPQKHDNTHFDDRRRRPLISDYSDPSQNRSLRLPASYEAIPSLIASAVLH